MVHAQAKRQPGSPLPSTSPRAANGAPPTAAACSAFTAPLRDAPLPLDGVLARCVRGRSGGPVLQRYTLERAPENNTLYSVSYDQMLVTGMATPNHVLLVADPAQLKEMNKVVRDSPLEFFAAAPQTVFGRRYVTVGLQFKRAQARTTSKESKIPVDDLQALYLKNVVPGSELFRIDMVKTKTAERDRKHGHLKLRVDDIGAALRAATAALDRFKKVAATVAASVGAWNETTEAIAMECRALVAIVESGLYSRDQTGQRIAALDVFVQEWMRDLTSKIERFDAIGKSELARLTEEAWWLAVAIKELAATMPAEDSVDLMSFHRVAFHAEVLAALRSPDNVLLYRACDVTASTLLGNKLTDENLQSLKTYSANIKGRGEFHYATNVARSGPDWVTLEGFAPGDLERDVSGADEDSLRNVDHTWQYIMQGSTGEGADGGLSPEDRYFTLYTQARYLLDGVYERGSGLFVMDTRRRKRHIQLGATSGLMNVQAWRRFAQKTKLPGVEHSFALMEDVRTRMMREEDDPLAVSRWAWDELAGELTPKSGWSWW